jgi:hypothetical protein
MAFPLYFDDLILLYDSVEDVDEFERAAEG